MQQLPFESDVVIHSCNPHIWDVEAGGLLLSMRLEWAA